MRLRALGASPLSFTEFHRIITSLSYPSLGRRLGALRLAGLIEAGLPNCRSTSYLFTVESNASALELVGDSRLGRSLLGPPIKRAIQRGDSQCDPT